MKRKNVCLILLLSVLTLGLVKPSVTTLDAATTAISFNTDITENNEFIINASLKNNDGLSELSLEVEYDKNVMELTDVTLSDYFVSFDKSPVVTSLYTVTGQSAYPCKILYKQKDLVNDSTNGRLFTMSFKLLDNIEDGTYSVTFNNETSYGSYYNSKNQILDKTIKYDVASVKVFDKRVDSISTNTKLLKEPFQLTKTQIIIIVCVGIFIALNAVSIILDVKKKKRQKEAQEKNNAKKKNTINKKSKTGV